MLSIPRRSIPTTRLRLVTRPTILSSFNQSRCYAQEATPRKSDSSKSSTASNPKNWKSKPPLATAQTLTLFSNDAPSLLIALKSTMTGILTSAKRAGKSPEVVGTEKEESVSKEPPKKSAYDFILLFTLSKDLPKESLGQAVSLLRGGEQDETTSSSSSIARIGSLSSSIPTSLIPDSSLSAPLDPHKPLHSVSISLLPASNSIPFRSVIGGKPKVQVGRWPDQKDSWNRKDDRLEWLGNQTQDQTDSKGREAESGREAEGEGEKTWKDLWGKENFRMDLPDELKNVNPNSILTTLLFSDSSPQGLLEALDSRFNKSSILGLISPPTPFQTGRARTMFSNLVQDEIHEDGAVGLVLTDGSDGDSFFKPSVKVDHEGFTTLGPRREITGARGNIISTLNSSNATQEFLRDIATRTKSRDNKTGSTDSILENLSKDKIRDISKDVKKEEDFYLGVFDSKDSEKPLLMSRIMSGHPTRGSLSIETESELGPEIGSKETENKNLWAQFYEKLPNQDFSPLDIPGPDPTVWAIPRFHFLSTSSESTDTIDLDSIKELQVEGEGEGERKKKKQVMALPNLFVAASEEGWIARNGNIGDSKAGEGMGGLKSKSQTCKVPLASALLSLRG